MHIFLRPRRAMTLGSVLKVNSGSTTLRTNKQMGAKSTLISPFFNQENS
jgi:hypothetical protein